MSPDHLELPAGRGSRRRARRLALRHPNVDVFVVDRRGEARYLALYHAFGRGRFAVLDVWIFGDAAGRDRLRFDRTEIQSRTA